ncbi:hypothetical protein LTR05_006508 [Lithohypha guttulata]|uniref:Uncharacterized protein n=1 Tax=Lithohypha guttulata TaxID=1690604 RepID=A0AAN7YEC7_9EURO|nr:hypothetical protein LTR05_006508 [Lithohypha guttulata]
MLWGTFVLQNGMAPKLRMCLTRGPSASRISLCPSHATKPEDVSAPATLNRSIKLTGYRQSADTHQAPELS